MKEALKLALEALIEMTPSGPTGSEIWHKQMSAIRVAGDALAQPEERPWVGLTEDERYEAVREAAVGSAMRRDGSTSERIARSVEAKLKEKNT